MNVIRSSLQDRLLAIVSFWLMSFTLGTGSVRAQDIQAVLDTNTVQIIKELQRRITELEHKVKTLEEEKQREQPGREQTEALQRKVNSIEEKQALSEETAKKAAQQVSLTENGFVFSSPDENFKLKLRGYIQADGRFYLNDSHDSFSDTFLLNRVRPVFEGTVYRNFDFKIMPDFGQGKTVIQDAYLDAHLFPALSLRAGKFKGLVGLERLQSARDLLFVERALPTAMVPNRDIGASVHGELGGGVFGYDIGVFNGSVDGGSNDIDENDGKDVAGRVFVHPFRTTKVEAIKGFGLGLAGSVGYENGIAPAYRSVGQQTFFSFNPGVRATGDRSRISPQGYYYWGPFGLLGEYVVATEDVSKGAASARLHNWAWQVSISSVLTGEKASYTGVAPDSPFNLQSGGWGAFELVGRLSQLHVDDGAFHNFGTAASPNTLADRTKSAGEAISYGVGLNWYLNKTIKLMTDYEEAHFEGGAAKGNRPAEQVIFSRIQIVF